MRSKLSDDLFESEEQYREDDIVEYVRTNPSRAEVEIGEVYHAISQELVNE